VSPSLKDVHWEISSLNEGTWAVGSILRDVVSKNLTAVLKIPVLDENDLEAIEKNYAVDSWLVKVIHKTKHGQRHHLATIFAPFRSRMQKNFSENQTKSIAFSLTYAAWATSERFRQFQCPAFSHRYRLKDFSVVDSEAVMEFNISSIGKFTESYIVTELVPPKITIAQSMVGDFYLEAALFNSKTKTLYSSFQQLPVHLIVREEKVVSVSGCEGVKQEYQP
jgi:hypothetical protein